MLLPKEERPRERLLQQGVQALSLTELFAIILGSGTEGHSVLQVAQEIVERFNGLDGLLSASLQELMQIKGVGKVKAIQLQAIFRVAQLSQQLGFAEKRAIRSAEDAYLLCRAELATLTQEALCVLLRDVKGHLIHQEIVAIGTLSEIITHPREIFYLAIRHKAASLILAHNHPSGDPTPSQTDIELTQVLIDAGRLLGIPVDDHLIICHNRFVSLKKLSSGPMGYALCDFCA